MGVFSFIRRHHGPVLGTVGLLLGVLGIVPWFQSDWRAFFSGADFYGVSAAAILAVLLAVAVNTVWRRDDAIDRLRNEHASEVVRLSDKHAAEVGHLKEESQTLTKEVTRLEALAARPQPTERDRELGAYVLGTWDLQGPICRFLDLRFIGKQWLETDTDPIYLYVDKTEHKFFDDTETQAAFASLQEAVRELTGWFAFEGGADNADNRDRVHKGEPLLYRIREARYVGYPEVDKIRRAGEQKARDVLKAAKEFERVARLRGL